MVWQTLRVVTQFSGQIQFACIKIYDYADIHRNNCSNGKKKKKKRKETETNKYWNRNMVIKEMFLCKFSVKT